MLRLIVVRPINSVFVMNNQQNSTEKLNMKPKHYLYYASPVVATTMLIAPMNIIQGIYAKHYGIALTTLAAIILVSRLMDTISDPIIGYLADRYQRKNGTRKPFIAVGVVLSLVCGYFIYSPPFDVTPFYATFWFIAFYTAFTLFEIPHQTWPADVHSSYRARLYSCRVFAIYCGLIIFYCVPLFSVFDTSDITPVTLKISFFLASIVILPALYLAVKSVPSGGTFVFKKDTGLSDTDLTVKNVFKNQPFIIFLAAFIFSGFSAGMWYGVIFIYVDSYLEMGDQFAKMFLVAFFVGALVTPLCYRLTFFVDKKQIWMFGVILMLMSFIFTGTLSPGTTSIMDLMIVKILQTCGLVCITVVTPIILSDIADYSQLKYKIESNGLYFSLKIFFEKVNVAGGMALALAIAGWYGFDMTTSAHSELSIRGLKLSASWMPSFCAIVSLIFVAISPIGKRRHLIIRNRLDALYRRNKDLL